ncbi:hypothetical protein ACA910_020249 [Epithemia clementina (nom. ined.)]
MTRILRRALYLLIVVVSCFDFIRLVKGFTSSFQRQPATISLVNKGQKSALQTLDIRLHSRRISQISTTTTTEIVPKGAIVLLQSSSSGYLPPQEDNNPSSSTKKKVLHPKAGDLVRYYDLDGGKTDGQVLVGRIRFIQKNLGGEGSGWTVELVEMDDLGDGYFADYGSRERWTKGTVYRDLLAVSPLSASFVRSENAYKVPTKAAVGTADKKPGSSARQLIVKAEQYDIEDYLGPFGGASADSLIDMSVVEADRLLYDALKGKLFRYSAIVGAVGTLIADLTRGTECAAIYLVGVASSLAYLLFLSFKTDTIGTERSQFGKNISNLRFIMPVFVLVGVTLYNLSRGESNPLLNGSTTTSTNMFQFVTPEQFAAAIIGFLTYRLPLLIIQIEDAFRWGEKEDGGIVLPGSAGIAMQLSKTMQQQQQQESSSSGGARTSSSDTMTTVFLISGPQATGRPELVKKLIEQGQGKFIAPTMVDRVADGATYERYERRGEFLYADESNRYGLTKQAIFDAGQKAAAGTDGKNIVVLDANVNLAEKLSRLPGLRLVGVWVGLKSVAEFEERLGRMIDKGELKIEDGETRESTIRGKIREIVKEIEFGISSGIFEFTILNDNEEQSLKQLWDASKYVN